MATTDENDPVLIPSLPEPWEGLVRGMTESIANEYDAMLGGDMRVIPDATHAASRAERDLRVALGDLLRDKWLLNGRDSGS